MKFLLTNPSAIVIFFILIVCPITPAAEPGQVSSGLGRLVSELPPDDPMAQRFQRMLREIQDTQPKEKMVSAVDMGDKEIARFIPFPQIKREYTPGASPYAEEKHLAVFQYNPKKLRIIDFLEEEQHWEQIKRGLHLRDWSQHPLVKKYPERGRILVLEDLAKRAVLEQHSKQMSWDLREELKRDLELVWEGTYGETKGAHLTPDFTPPSTSCLAKLATLAPRPAP